MDLCERFAISLTSCDRAADLASRPGFAKLNAFGLRSVEAVSLQKHLLGRYCSLPPVCFFFSLEGL
jgi:hypothetical protein